MEKNNKPQVIKITPSATRNLFYQCSSKTRSKKDATKNDYDIIVFCHLRWEFVYQRPQHIISRLAKEHKILLIEEPIPHAVEEENTFEKRRVARNLDVWQPKVKNIEAIAPLLKSYLGKTSFPTAWFYSAAFIPLLETFEFDNIIYDCMDELSLFKGASLHLIEQEMQLMKRAKTVFTGGMSLYESKKQKHHNVHCFRSSVDESHFAKACSILEFPPDIANISNPIVGYFGVIDERINLNLLKETAEKMPSVAFVMIGPVVKIHESDLPQRDNIYYLGMKSYDELPAYLAAFDIAMMPFALNDSTKYISPTKTLEYMAAEKPIISTKIHDVVRDYHHCVNLVDNADDFCNAINKAEIDYKKMLRDYKEVLKNTSWDATVDKMQSIMKKAVTQ